MLYKIKHDNIINVDLELIYGTAVLSLNWRHNRVSDVGDLTKKPR